MSALAGVKEGTGRFLGWWGGELLGLVPDPVVRALAPGKARLVLYWAREGVEVRVEDADTRPAQQSGAILDPETLTRCTIAGAVGELALSLPTVIVLASETALTQSVTLPLAAEATLQDVLRYELDRLTPFSAEEAYTAGRVRRRLPARQSLEADLVLVPRKLLDPILETVRGCGLAVEHVDVAAAGTGETIGVNLVAGAGPKAGLGLGARIFMVLMVLVLILGAAALFVSFDKRQGILSTLEDELGRVRRLAVQLDMQRQDVAEREAGQAAVTRLKTDRPLTVEVLEEVTRLLPDDSFLESFRLKDASLTIGGQAAQSAALIAVFEASPLFAEVNFAKPTMQAAGSDRETFSIAMRLVPRGAAP